MSDCKYWECVAHDPPIRTDVPCSGPEYGLHEMRKDYENREFLAEAQKLGLGPSGPSSAVRVLSTKFFAEHPNCDLQIVSGSGFVYSPVGTAFTEQSPPSKKRRLWIDAVGLPVVTFTPRGAENAVKWGWTPAEAVPVHGIAEGAVTADKLGVNVSD